MKIAFIPGSCAPFNGKTLDQRPLGGTETAVIRLAQALDRMGHTVYVFSHHPQPPVTKPLYLPLSALGDLGTVDALVSVRELLPLFAGVQSRASFFWTGDSYDQLQHLGLGDRRVIQRTTALWAVSDWQADRLCAVSGFPREKVWLVRNGYEHSLFTGHEDRVPKRLIYSSTPFRGLDLLRNIFPRIRSAHPDTELHVFSGMQVYQGAGGHTEADRQFAPLYDALRSLPGVTLHGNVLQRDLAREFMRSSILAYPNTFEETSCITAIEAMAAGCAIVTSSRGALPETIGDAGVLIDGEPGSSNFLEKFTQLVIGLLSDHDAWSLLSQRSLQRAQYYSWDVIAQQVTERLIAHISTSAATAAQM